MLSATILSSIISFSQKEYKIDGQKAITPVITPGPENSFTFILDQSLAGKVFEIYKADGSTVASLKDEVLGGEILAKKPDQGFEVVIQNNRKIKGCSECYTVPNDFVIKIDGISHGPFHLTPAQKADDVNRTVPKEETYQSGSIINDAIFIATSKKGNSKIGTLKKLLKDNYGIDATNYQTNYFFKDNLGFAFNSIEGAPLSLQSIGSSIGGLNVTSIADGFAKFIVKRVKEELSITFFKKFKEEISASDMKIVFPNTAKILLAIDDQIYNYNTYINNLREAFRSDMQTLDENLPGIVDKYDDLFKREGIFTLGVSLRTACFVSTSLKHDMHPGDMLAGYPLSYFDNAPLKDKPAFTILKGSIQTLQLMSESLKEIDTSKHSYWSGMDKIRQLVNDRTAFEIYIGLLIHVANQKYEGIKYTDNGGHDKSFYNTLNQKTVYDAFAKDIPKYKEFLLTLASRTNELNNMVKTDEKNVSDSVKIEQYAKYFNSSVDLLEYCINIGKLPYLNTVAVLAPDQAKTYFDVSRQTCKLVTSINRKRYAESVNQLLLLYNDIVVTAAEKNVTNNAAVNASVTSGVTVNNAAGNTTVTTNVAVTMSAKTKETRQSLIKYGAFMSSMIAAQNSDEVANIIESAVLPAGSASIKRESAVNVALNAYCGLFIGNEVIKELEADKVFGNTNAYGLTAPIGISFSKGHRILPWPLSELWKTDCGWSSSWFLSVVDLGAIAAYRFTDDKAEKVPTIELKDIFSPGLFWSVGVPKTPISMNLGFQVGPNLRKVTGTANDYSSSTYVRYSFSVCVDIPLLNFHTKAREKK